ncbi:MAG: FG-GAP-like repeat-containing protein [Chthoniobacter sp.]|uniref:FG-GAP-like repeat-containing protein n=1 Tax=Chthoniobacter sp. TaxID=2510640 RepID=UPI0032AC9014
MLHFTPAGSARSTLVNRLVALAAAATGFLPLVSEAGAITPADRYPTADDQYELQLINQARLSADGLTVLHTLVSNNLNAITPSTTETAQDGTPWKANFWVSSIPEIAYAMNFYHVHPGDLKKQYLDLQLPGFPLAWNSKLGNTAAGYDDLVLANQGAGPGWPHDLDPYSKNGTFDDFAQRYLDGGYGPLADLDALSENILADGYNNARSRFAGYMIDWGNTPDGIQDQDPNFGSHRLTLMDDGLSEVGIATKPGWDAGKYSNVEEFGDRASPPPAIVGAVYVDFDKNGTYTPGEGVASATVSAQPTTGGTTLQTRTFRSGGYVLPVSKAGTYTVTVKGTFGTVSAGAVTVGTRNVACNILCSKGQPFSDFNSDGRPDILIANLNNGVSTIWYLNSGYPAGQHPGPLIPVGWTVVSVSDLNGDGYPDFLLYLPASRRVVMYYLHLNSYLGQADGPTVPTGYTLIGAEDFNRDGQIDYLLYNAAARQSAIWYLNGTTKIGTATGPSLLAGWSIAGVGDFNSDGCPDLALYNSTTQQTQIYYLNDAKVLGKANGPTIPAGWALVGVADFDAEGHPDFLLSNNTTGETRILFLKDTTLLRTLNTQTVPAGQKLISP